MASRVLLHIGLPKTATTYLQRVLWDSREQLRAEGVLLPGRTRKAHLWVSRLVRHEELAEGITKWQAGSWDRLRTEIAEWPGTALLSHEFFAAASREEAQTMIAELAPAEVHVVLTAREPLGLFAASWQERLKNRGTEPMTQYAAEVSESSADIWNWRTLDLSLVLERWAPPDGAVPAHHVHVLPLPIPDQPRETIWHRFAGLLGVDAGAYDLSSGFANASMGVVEAETLRRVNVHLESFWRAIDKGTYVRSFLADERLVPREGERFWPEEHQIEDCRARARAAVQLVRERGFDVVGELDDLLVPEVIEPRRSPDSVSDAEVAEVAVELVATMLDDVRSLRHERRALRDELVRAHKETASVIAEGESLRRRPDVPLWRIAGSRAKRALGRGPAAEAPREIDHDDG